MRTTMRTILVLALVLTLLVLAVPVYGSTAETDSGATLVNNDVLVPAGTPHAAVKYIEHVTGSVGPTTGHGGGLNVPRAF